MQIKSTVEKQITPEERKSLARKNVNGNKVKSVEYAAESARVRSKGVAAPNVAPSMDVSGMPSRSETQPDVSTTHYGYIDGKIRAKANPISETLDPPLILQIENPFQVRNRLMNLMGSNKVRISSKGYVKTLYERLLASEEDNFNKRKEERELSENTREVKLIIDGKLEPREDQAYLNKNPVIRVNRQLHKLDVLNATFFETQQQESGGKMPKITPVEPFEHDLSGGIFKTYSNHRRRKKTISESGGNKRKYLNNHTCQIIEEVEEEMEEKYVEEVFEYSDQEEEEMDYVENMTFGTADEFENFKKGSIVSIPGNRSISAYMKPDKLQEEWENSFCKQHKASNCSLFNADAYKTLSMQNLVSDFKYSIASNEQAQREIMQSTKHNDPLVSQLDKENINNVEMFDHAHKISKLNQRKQRAADDKLRKVEVGNYYIGSKREGTEV